MKQQRIHDIYRPAAERMRDFREVERRLTREEIACQSGRCMSCGIPFCHGAGCPLGNVIPEMNAAVHANDMKSAWHILAQTSNFPEFTSRICPALCEGSCTEGLNEEPVMVRQLEKIIVETAFENGWVQPVAPAHESGRRVAVVGSGPAGLAMADELRRAGHHVTIFERNHQPGGLLRYGIPCFKLDKSIIDRRVELMRQSGIEFRCGCEIGKDISGNYLKRNFDALVLAVGTPAARDLPVPGRELSGIHFALDFLGSQTRKLNGEIAELEINARGKRVVVIGGGDTGSDCVGTSIRQGAASVLQIELMPEPPADRSASTPWPQWPYMLRTSSSHKEGGEREWDILTKRFTGADGQVTTLETVKLAWEFTPTGRPLKFTEVPDSARTIEADLVLLALGFTGVPAAGMAEELQLAVTPRGSLTGKPEAGIFTIGDAVNGPSLVVRAIADAKQKTAAVNAYLKGIC